MSAPVGSLAGARRRAVGAARRVARRPRAWLRTIGAHRSTTAARDGARRARDRTSLSLAALAGRRERGSAWTRLETELAALPPAPPLTRTVSIVVVPVPGQAASAHPAGLHPTGTDAANVDVTVARPEPGETPAAAAARVASATTGDLVCFWAASTAAIEAGWIARLARALDGGAVAAAPQVVHPLRSPPGATPYDARVRSLGFGLDVESDAPRVRARGAGTSAVVDAAPSAVPGASAACLLVDRAAYEAAGALPPLAGLDLAGFELCRRLRARGGTVVAVPAAVVVDRRPVASWHALTVPIPTDTPAWRAFVEDHGPELMREADPLPAGVLRIALTVAAPSAKVASRWGDWHLAQAFARSLRERGHAVRVQTFDHADDLAGRACDVYCVVRGLQTVRRTPGQAHVLWIISHPENVEAAECDAADLVFVASTRFAEELRSRTRTPVEVLLQATDANRFRPLPADPRYAHDVAVVAKSRNVFRPAVADALAAGLRPAIYGSGWEPFVDRALVVSDYIPNEELPSLYSSVGVLLNDQWQTMRDWGFVSNRLFDALACGTPVISEELAELDDLFEASVLTYHDVTELRALVDAALSDRAAARARAERGRALVLAHHTFDHRAEQFVDALRRHGLVPPAPG